MLDLITEILGLLAVAALAGLAIGYLIWGWGRRAALSAARAEGAAGARTSVDGSVPMRAQLDQVLDERDRLRTELNRLRSEQALETGPAGVPGDDDASPQPAQPFIEPASEETPLPHEPIADGSDSADAEDAVRRAGVEVVHLKERTAEPVADAHDGGSDPSPAAATASPAVSSDAAPVEAPRSLLQERPEDVDDLKRIKGVGPKMERILNEKGVYLFHQIANFSAADAAWVNAAISAFPGRIERDRWVAQAQALYLEKYGKPHDA